MADEWLADHSDNKLAVDTCLVYEPIFRKYGYDTDDFKASVEYYMRDPLRFSRMMKDVALKMEAESDKLLGIKAAEEEEAETETETETEEIE